MILTNFLQQVEISPKNSKALNANARVQKFIASQQFDDLFNFVTNLLNDPALANCSKKPESKYIGQYTCNPDNCSGRPLINFSSLDNSSKRLCENDYWIARISLDSKGIKSAPIYFPPQIVNPSLIGNGIVLQQKNDKGKNVVFAVLDNLLLLKQNSQPPILISAVQKRLA